MTVNRGKYNMITCNLMQDRHTYVISMEVTSVKRGLVNDLQGFAYR